jgi:hypothetical protein
MTIATSKPPVAHYPTAPSQRQQLEMLDLCQDILDYIESKEPVFDKREDAPEVWLKLWELRGHISGWNLR